MIKVNINGAHRNIGLCGVYLRSPLTYDTLTKFLSNVNTVMESIDDVIIVGDFNMSSISWSRAGDKLVPANFQFKMGFALLDFMNLNCLEQFNDEPNVDGKILDLVLANLQNVVVSRPMNPLSKLDGYHPPLLITLNTATITFLPQRQRTDFNFYLADFPAITEKLKGIDWLNKLSPCKGSVDEMVAVLYSCLDEVISVHVPKRRPSRNNNYPPWFSNDLVRLLAEKNKLRKRYSKFKNPRDKIEYQICRSRCDRLYRKCYSQYICKTERSITTNPKAFWKYIKERRKNTSSLPSRMNLDNTSASTGSEICNIFANHFSSTFSSDLEVSPNVSIPQNFISDAILNNIKKNEATVLKALKQLDPGKGSGPDGLPPLFLKRCAEALTYPLTFIFNTSLKSGVFPSRWKEARIVPVHKKGELENVRNYRPISILSSFSKLFESLVCPVISNHTRSMISIKQHGFQRGKSVTTNLVAFVADIAENLEKRIQTDAIYTDFSSAFDMVSHAILLRKLGSYGICGTLHSWFSSYLKDRRLQVVAGGYESDPYISTSGVPQGSHLGPVLFLLFINDITKYIKHCSCSVFADDMKIYRPVKSLEDVRLIQEDLNSIKQWCDQNYMSLNVSKCNHIKFTKNINKVESSYLIGSGHIKEVTEIRDLGVILDSKLSFSAHYDHIIAKSFKMLGFIKRSSKKFKNSNTKILLFNALVKSSLEYSSVIWNPMYNVHNTRLERVQKSFTRHLAYHEKGFSRRNDYNSRLEYFKMVSLENRRQLMDQIFLWKIINHQICSPEALARISLSVPRSNRRLPHTSTFYIPVLKANTTRNSPVYRMLMGYNRINARLHEKNKDIDVYHDSLGSYRNKVLDALHLG